MFDHGQNYGPEYPYDPDSASYPDEASQNNSFDRPHFGDAEAFVMPQYHGALTAGHVRPGIVLSSGPGLRDQHSDAQRLPLNRRGRNAAGRGPWHIMLSEGSSVLHEVHPSDPDDSFADDGPRSTLSFRIDNAEEVSNFIIGRLKLMQQLADKKIAKAWIKGICPRKQARFPYQNKNRENDNARHVQSVPGWWPETSVCRFIEPDHVKRDERMKLCLHLLRLRPTPEQLKFWNDQGKEPHLTPSYTGWTAFLRQQAGSTIFDDMPGETDERTAHRKELLHQMYQVAEMEEEYQKGKLDGSTIFHWTKEGEERKNINSKRPRCSISGCSEAELMSPSPKNLKLEPASTALPIRSLASRPDYTRPMQYSLPPSGVEGALRAESKFGPALPSQVFTPITPTHPHLPAEHRPSVHEMSHTPMIDNYVPSYESPVASVPHTWSDHTTSPCSTGSGSINERFQIRLMPHDAYPEKPNYMFTPPFPVSATEMPTHIVHHIPEPAFRSTAEYSPNAPHLNGGIYAHDWPLTPPTPECSGSFEDSPRLLPGGEDLSPTSTCPGYSDPLIAPEVNVSPDARLVVSISCSSAASPVTSPNCEGQVPYEQTPPHYYEAPSVQFTQPASWHNRPFTGYGSGVGDGQPT